MLFMANNPGEPKTSRYIFGAGIVLTGALVICIGLILGIGFPRYIKDRRLTRQCITSERSPDYMNWVRETLFPTTDLYQYQLLGPYVFIETETKMDVSFQNGMLTYRSWKKQEFDETLTQKLCANCSLYDMITTVNPAFLQLVDSYVNETHYYLSLIPRLLADHRTRVTNQKNGTSSDFRQWRPWKMDDVDFDKWIAIADTDYKQIILKDKRRQVAPSIYLSIYDIIGSPDLYGLIILKKIGLWYLCEEKYRKLLNCSITRYYNNDGVEMPPNCGLIFYLYQFFTTSLNDWHLFRKQLTDLFCSWKSTPCFLDVGQGNHQDNQVQKLEINNDNNTYSEAYLQAIVHYTMQHLTTLVSSAFPIQSMDMHATLSVQDLAKGFYVQGHHFISTNCSEVKMNACHSESSGDFSWWPYMDLVGGMLDHHETEQVAKEYSKRISLRTCLFNRSREDNLIYEEIEDPIPTEGSDQTSYSASFLKISGLQDYTATPVTQLLPCTDPSPSKSYYSFYVSDIRRPMNFSRLRCTYYKEWVLLHKYVMELAPNETDLLSTTEATGYLSWVQPATKNSLPDYSSHGDGAIEDMKDNVDNKAFNNQIFLEPVSGEIWSTRMEMQFYFGIKQHSANRTNNHNYSADYEFQTPIKSHIIYAKTEPSENMLTTYNKEVYILLKVSCSGLITLSIVGSVITLAGLGVAFRIIERHPHKVSPEINSPCDGFAVKLNETY